MDSVTVDKISGEVNSSENLPIYYDLYVPDTGGGAALPVVIFLHGFKGFKDWGAFPKACEILSSSGFGVVAMNFSHNGVGKSMTEFDRLDLFARETFSRDLDDVASVITALRERVIDSGRVDLDSGRIGLLGHSRGGHTAVAAAAEHPEVACLVTWSAVADYNARWSKEMIEDWEQRGVTEIKNGRTGQLMPVNREVYEDALENADRVIALNRVDSLDLPALFVHSRGDEAVSYHEAEKLYSSCPSNDKELKLIADSGHTFDTSHPFDEQELPQAFREVLEATRVWFQRHLQ